MLFGRSASLFVYAARAGNNLSLKKSKNKITFRVKQKTCVGVIGFWYLRNPIFPIYFQDIANSMFMWDLNAHKYTSSRA